MSDPDDFDRAIEEIWSKEFAAETEANHQMAENHQRIFEQSIGNIQALKSINNESASLVEMVKNS